MFVAPAVTAASDLERRLLPQNLSGDGSWESRKGYRPARVRATILTLLLGLQIADILLFAFVLLWFAGLAEQPLPPSDPEVDALLFLVYIGLAAAVVGFGGGWFAFVAWISRSIDNAPHLLGGTPKWSPAWSIGWWLIPIANLFMPYRTLADLNRRMAWGIGPSRAWIILVWWLSNIACQVVPIFIQEPDISTRAEAISLIRVFTFTAGTLILTTIALQLIVIWRIQRHAERRAELIASDPETRVRAPA